MRPNRRGKVIDGCVGQVTSSALTGADILALPGANGSEQPEAITSSDQKTIVELSARWSLTTVTPGIASAATRIAFRWSPDSA
jgi:hypothetical protein